MNAGKGDSPRNCFSKKFKRNYEKIDWTSKSVGVNLEAEETVELEEESHKNSIQEIK